MPIHKAAAIHPFAYRTGALEFLISKGARLDVEDKVHTVMIICILQQLNYNYVNVIIIIRVMWL